MIDMSLGSKDRKKIDEYISVKKKRFGEEYFSIEYLENDLLEKVKNLPTVVKLVIAFVWQMDSVVDSIFEYSFYTRYLKNDVKILLNGLYTAERLKYLVNVAAPLNYGGIYSIHISDVIKAIAIDDKKLINAYLKNKPGPFVKSIAEFNILSNGLYAVLNNDYSNEEKITNEIKRVINLKSVRPYEKAFLNCISCLITHDYSSYSEYINIILDRHNKQETLYNEPVGEDISLPALAFYNLAYFDKERKTPMPAEPVHQLWDSELWHEIIKDNQKTEYIIDVAKVSPVLKQWMDELPEKLDFEKLI